MTRFNDILTVETPHREEFPYGKSSGLPDMQENSLREDKCVATLGASVSIPQRYPFSAWVGAARPTCSGAHDAVQAARFRPDAHAVAHALELWREPLERDAV
jgi:hypothetical protein